MKQIQRFRTYRRMTQKELGERLGMYGSQICRIENGTITPTTDQIKKIAKELDVSYKVLMNS